MASEAQRLIGISLKKVSQSRAHRGGVSLHKNLLVATVLQKARYIFMEEAYHMIHYSSPDPVQTKSENETVVVMDSVAEEIDTTISSENENPLISSNQRLNVPQTACVKCTKIQQNKENNPFHNNNESSSYGNSDKSSKVLREKSNSFSSTSSLKRRRAAADRETKGVVHSVVLPKRSRKEQELETSEVDSSNSTNNDSVFSDDTDTTPVASIGTTNVEIKKCGSSGSAAMEIDRITSLVSIFSFNMGGGDGTTGKLCRSVSTPDLCSAQANNPPDSIQRPFLAMTV